MVESDMMTRPSPHLANRTEITISGLLPGQNLGQPQPVNQHSLFTRNHVHCQGPGQEQVRDQSSRLRPSRDQTGAHQAVGGDQGQERGGKNGASGHDPRESRHDRPPRHRRPPHLLQLQAEDVGAERGHPQLHLGPAVGDDGQGVSGVLHLHHQLQPVRHHNLQLQRLRPLHQQ